MTTFAPFLVGVADATARVANGVLPEPVGEVLMQVPFAEVVLGAAAMAGLFVVFGLRAPAEGSGGCGSCAGDCGSCVMEEEECQ
ncbi:MAG: hypothetical protein JSU98_03360 [Gemmatimonadales bacterium]|nr:MAG: hypothetical protein JSU98_03360 [Gemmatimonadales bacterium]